jgi:hypothetical protein
MFADFRVHGLNKMGDPDFCYAALANATKLHRKSGGSPSFFFFL